MKKILLKAAFLTSLLTVISCTHQDQKMRFDLTLNNSGSEVGKGVGISVAVFDERSNVEVVGKKRFGKEKIQIKTEQNLAEFLQQKITENLMMRGFSSGKDKNITIYIKNFKYNAWRHFPIGLSEAHSMITVVVKTAKSTKEFNKNFVLTLNKKHFIAPLESTDEETINFLLQEIVQNILSDDDFLKSLVQ